MQRAKEAVIVHSSSGDWSGLYIDGTLRHEGHSIRPEHVLQALDIPCEHLEAKEDWLENRGSLPEKLKDVSLT